MQGQHTFTVYHTVRRPINSTYSDSVHEYFSAKHITTKDLSYQFHSSKQLNIHKCTHIGHSVSYFIAFRFFIYKIVFHLSYDIACRGTSSYPNNLNINI